jgi:hypothetical protein
MQRRKCASLDKNLAVGVFDPPRRLGLSHVIRAAVGQRNPPRPKCIFWFQIQCLGNWKSNGHLVTGFQSEKRNNNIWPVGHTS